MSAPAVYLSAVDPVAVAAIRASFEEEAVPLHVVAEAPAGALPEARAAARRSPLAVGIAVDEQRIVVSLASGPSVAYLEGPVSEARLIGRQAARLVARRPLTGPR